MVLALLNRWSLALARPHGAKIIPCFWYFCSRNFALYNEIRFIISFRFLSSNRCLVLTSNQVSYLNIFHWAQLVVVFSGFWLWWIAFRVMKYISQCVLIFFIWNECQRYGISSMMCGACMHRIQLQTIRGRCPGKKARAQYPDSRYSVSYYS